MKKRNAVLVGLSAALMLGLCGCGDTSDAPPSQSSETETEAQIHNEDYMLKHIQSIEPENREEFLYFWKNAVSYCGAIEFDLSEMGNVNSYEFDPTDESQIPSELSTISGFSKFEQSNTEKLHKDFHMKIEGDNVMLSFDGIPIYPTDYGYGDIRGMIDSLSAE